MTSRMILSCLLILTACSQNLAPSQGSLQPGVQVDESIVRGLAVVEVTGGDRTSLSPMAVGSSTVVYNNAPQVAFEIDASALVAGAMSGNILNLGHVSVKNLVDNDLSICGSNGNKKCTIAEIRVYTTGDVAGFVNTSEVPNYGMPVFASGLNPTTPLILNSPGVAVQQVGAIPPNKHNLKLSDFPNPTYNVTSDFTDAGSGSYKMTFVVEYALKP